MTHPLVEQLRFTRREWVRGLQGVSAAEAQKHFEPLNCISWMVGHLAWHEQLCWLIRAQGTRLVPDVAGCANGAPQTTPPLEAMWDGWHRITEASDAYLDTLTTETLQTHYQVKGKTVPESIGTMIRRVTYHYWYHLGEAQAVRQLLGHRDLPQFVGDISTAPYRPE